MNDILSKIAVSLLVRLRVEIEIEEDGTLNAVGQPPREAAS